MTEIFHDVRVSTVTSLNNLIQALGLCTPVNKNTKYVFIAE